MAEQANLSQVRSKTTKIYIIEIFL